MDEVGRPRHGSPRSIAILGWARLSLQQNEGSGYNLSASELAAGLAGAGHRVSYLRSGMHYALGRGPFVRSDETWRGVRCFDLVNSPNLSPAAANFGNLDHELADPQGCAVVLDWLDSVGAELVHVHSLEGFSLDLIARVRESGRPLVVTPHNYWYLCPQVDLLRGEAALCHDYEGGEKCVGCLDVLDPATARRRRMLRQTLEAALGTDTLTALRSALGGLRRRLSPANAAREAPGPEVEAVEEPWRPDPVSLDANERFLEASHHREVRNAFGARRSAGVDALNSASLVIPPSDFLRRAYSAMGVEEKRIRIVRLGQPHFDQIHQRACGSPYYEVPPWDSKSARRPLRFAFFGTMRNNKGLATLVHAIPLLDEEVRQRCQFLIRASGWDWPFRTWLLRYPEVQFLGGYDLHHLVSAGGEYDVGIMCQIWFENSPLVLLEHLHGGKFVVTSRLGGPADWIKAPENGLFYPAGNPEDLAECIRKLVVGDVPIPSPREIHELSALRSYPEHVAEVEQIYSELLSSEA